MEPNREVKVCHENGAGVEYSVGMMLKADDKHIVLKIRHERVAGAFYERRIPMRFVYYIDSNR